MASRGILFTIRRGRGLRECVKGQTPSSSFWSGSLSCRINQFGLTSYTLKNTWSSSTVTHATRGIHTSSCIAAGHSKWSNIKHIKAAQDKVKGEKSTLLARKVQLALIKSPEKDPKQNSELANLIKWARTNNIPNDVIDRTVEKQIKLRDPKCITCFDGRGPGNTGIIIESFSLNQTHTKNTLQGVTKRFGFNLHSPAADLFDHKGVIEVELPEEEIASAKSDPENFPMDKYIEMAIEGGAEDIKLEMDDGKPYLEFTCGPFDVSKVHLALEEKGLKVINSERVYIPNLVVPVSKEFIENLEKLSEKLDLNPDVIKYHFNAELES